MIANDCLAQAVASLKDVIPFRPAQPRSELQASFGPANLLSHLQYLRQLAGRNPVKFDKQGR